MLKNNWIRIFGIFVLFVVIALGNIGGGQANAQAGHTFTFKNNTSEAIWVGGFSNPPANNNCPMGGGSPQSLPAPNWNTNDPWRIDQGDTEMLTVPFCWTSGLFWARTGCTITPTPPRHPRPHHP